MAYREASRKKKRFPGQYQFYTSTDIPRYAETNVLCLTKEEALVLTEIPVPEDNSTNTWICIESNLNDLLPKLTSKNKTTKMFGPLENFEVLVAFYDQAHNIYKACLYDKIKQKFIFVSSTNIKPIEKTVYPKEDGWYIYKSLMSAPPTYWNKVKVTIRNYLE